MIFSNNIDSTFEFKYIYFFLIRYEQRDELIKYEEKNV